jgi:hypothetical protein
VTFFGGAKSVVVVNCHRIMCRQKTKLAVHLVYVGGKSCTLFDSARLTKQSPFSSP